MTHSHTHTTHICHIFRAETPMHRGGHTIGRHIHAHCTCITSSTYNIYTAHAHVHQNHDPTINRWGGAHAHTHIAIPNSRVDLLAQIQILDTHIRLDLALNMLHMQHPCQAASHVHTHTHTCSALKVPPLRKGVPAKFLYTPL